MCNVSKTAKMIFKITMLSIVMTSDMVVDDICYTDRARFYVPPNTLYIIHYRGRFLQVI